jgi:hypothetical protein
MNSFLPFPGAVALEARAMYTPVFLNPFGDDDFTKATLLDEPSPQVVEFNFTSSQKMHNSEYKRDSLTSLQSQSTNSIATPNSIIIISCLSKRKRP